MPAFGHLRMLDAFSRLEDEARSRLLARLAALPRAQEARDLSDAGAIRERAGTLDEGGLALLRELVVSMPEAVEDLLEEEDRARLEALGLVLLLPGDEDDEEGMPVIPFEVREALLEEEWLEQADLALWLSRREEEELLELAELHNVAPLPDQDRLGLALQVAEAMLAEEALRDLHDSLQPSSRRLLHWLCWQGTTVTEGSLRGRQERISEQEGEPGPSGERVLVRLGLVHVQEAAGGPRYVLPMDVRWSLALLLDGVLGDEAGEAWLDLRGTGLPAFRDVFPRGSGGDPLDAARSRVLRTLVFGQEAVHPLDRILQSLRIVDAERSEPGELASAHLDVSGPEAFARQALRTWLSWTSDDWTSALVAGFGGDLGAFEAHFQRPGAEVNPLARDPLAMDWDRWGQFLLHLRAHLLFGLSVLPAGHWFSIPALGGWLTRIYRMVTHRLDGLNTWLTSVPREALPLSPVDIDHEVAAAVSVALEQVLAEFFEPLGIVTMHASGRLFMPNAEGLRVFRDGDPGFDIVWEMAEAYLGDDLDLWLPLPNDPGPRISGVAAMTWVGENALRVERASHLHDHLRLARWAAPVHDGVELLYVFDADQVARGEESDADAEEFLLWLRVRTAHPVPTAVRTLFSMSSAVVDGTEPAVDAAVTARVEALHQQLVSWGDQPSLAVMEELRGWGPRVIRQLLPLVERTVKARRFSRKELPHLLLLFGELGDARTCPVLLRSLAYGTDEVIEGIAAMACARTGAPALQGLIALLNSATAGVEKRMAAAATMCSMAVLHPDQSELIFEAVARFLETDELEVDVITITGVHLAETGHPDVEGLLFQLREQGLWIDELMSFDEAVWIGGISPSVWGHPFYAAPLALIFPTSSESRHLAREAGIDELLHGSGVGSDAILGSLTGPAWRRKRS